MSKAEKFIQDHTRDCSNQYDLPEFFENGIKRLKEYQPWLTPSQARKAVEIAREETVKEVCEWIKYNNENGGCLFDGWENDLKKYLEGKK